MQKFFRAKRMCKFIFELGLKRLMSNASIDSVSKQQVFRTLKFRTETELSSHLYAQEILLHK